MQKVLKFLSHMRIGLRLRLLLFLLLVSTPLVGLISHISLEERRRETAAWQQRGEQTLQLAAHEESDLAASTRFLLAALAESSAVRSGKEPGCRKLLEEARASHPRYSNLGVINTNGQVLASVLASANGENWADRPFFQRTLKTSALAIGNFPVGLPPGRAIINFGFPVVGPAGQIQAVIFATLNLSWFSRFESKVPTELPKGSTWTKLDRRGTILVRYPMPSMWIGQPLPEEALVEAVFSRSSGVTEHPDAHGVPTVYAFAVTRDPFVAGPVAGVLGIPRRELFADANLALRRNLAWLGGAAGLALVLGWVGSNILVLRPVKALVASSARLAAGDLSARTGLPHGRDELGQLTRAFDHMAQALEQRENERRRAEETLQVRDDMIRELPVLPAAMYLCNMEGAIELYNRTAVELWGYEPLDRYAGKRFCGSYRLFDADGAPMSHDSSPMAEVLRTGIPARNRELTVGRPDGTRVAVLANIVPVRDSQGLMVGAVCSLQDITERKLSEERLKESNEQLQAMSRRLVEAQETERRHIARELHDEIGQTLTAAEMNLQAALQSQPSAPLQRRLEESLQAVEQVLEQVHDLSLNLRPSMLDDLGLVPTLRWYINRQSSLAGLQTEFRADPLEHRLDPLIETECFRIAQEALTNIVRHAQARTLTVELNRKDGCLHLSVRDDGIGFDVAAVRERAVHGASLGLLSMEERAAVAGGGLKYHSAPAQGTEIHAWFPLKWQTPPV